MRRGNAGSTCPGRFSGVQLEPDPPVHRELVAFTATAEVPHIAAFIDILAEHGAVRSRPMS